MIFCDAVSCQHNDDGTCANDNIFIQDSDLTDTMVLPVCTDYVKTDWESWMEED